VNLVAENYEIEHLSEQHERSTFVCGVVALDRYLRERAGQELRKHVATPFLAVHRQTKVVAGFYTLASTAIDPVNLPHELAKKLPRYPLIPATLLGRLAVDKNHRGQKLGEFLLMDSLQRSLEASRQLASFAVVVDAKDESAVAFYHKYGFIPFADKPNRLFLPMKTIGQLFT